MNSSAVFLIVDDEIQIRRFLQITLAANGYQVYETETGEEALAKAAQRRPDLIILDMGLPDVDGLVVLQRLRGWTKTPVIVLSVRDTNRDKVTILGGVCQGDPGLNRDRVADCHRVIDLGGFTARTDDGRAFYR